MAIRPFPGLSTVFYALGWLLVILAAAMLVPLLVDLAFANPDWLGFLGSSGITAFFGVALLLSHRHRDHGLSLRAAFLMTASSWIVTAFFAALPFRLGGYNLSLTDALFEAVSAMTTTGSTVITGLDRAPPGFLLWRSLLQWVGGIGIIVMALVLLPFLRIGGMQLFRSESSDRSEKVLPTTAEFVRRLVAIYLALTLFLAVALRLAGMPAFDAINHAFTSIATGGFSTRDASIAAFDSEAVELVLLLGMLMGALPYARYVGLAAGRGEPFLADSQIRTFLVFLALASLAVALWLVTSQGRSIGDALLAATFNLVSIVTTTGYSSEDYTLWGAPAVALFLAVTVVGGCTGSTAGGIKIFRFEILWIATREYLVQLFLPSRIGSPRYAGKPVTGQVIIAVLSYVFLFIGSWGVLTVVLGALGLDLVTAVSAAATTLANVGPGLGPIIGPSGNFAALGDAVKWVLLSAMLLGRLEFFTLLVLFHPQFWRR